MDRFANSTARLPATVHNTGLLVAGEACCVCHPPVTVALAFTLDEFAHPMPVEAIRRTPQMVWSAVYGVQELARAGAIVVFLPRVT